MHSTIPKEIWSEHCDGYSFTDCAIRNKDMIYLLATEDKTQDEQKSKMQLLLLVQEGDNIEHGYSSFDESFWAVVCTSEKPVEQGLIIQVLGGSVIPTGGPQRDWPVEDIKQNELLPVRKAKKIDGFPWVVGSHRAVFRRVDIGKWIAVDNGLKVPEDLSDTDFLDIDGFTSNDIYAVGGKGDIWHYDGQIWKQCGFPTNDKLTAVCCAGDGNVYVAAKHKLWKGRLNRWEAICELELTDKISDLHWFNNKIWGCGKYDFFCWNGITLETEVVYQGSPLALMGTMDCCEHFLLVARRKSVWVYNGQQWVNIVPESM